MTSNTHLQTWVPREFKERIAPGAKAQEPSESALLRLLENMVVPRRKPDDVHFVAQLRALGVAANATERAVRGSNSFHMKNPSFRAGQRGESTHARRLAQDVENELRTGSLGVEGGKMRMLKTRRNVS